MSFSEELKSHIEEAEEIIQSYLPAEQGFQKKLLEAANYGVLAGGKRLRPILMQETYRLFDGKGKIIEPFMAAIEMIHTASLDHDDLPCMDNDRLRRGKPSTWDKYGEDFGVLAGDALMIYAFEVATQAFSMAGSPSQIGRALSVLANKTGIYGMIGGQSVDVEWTGQPLKKDVLDFIYRLKTGALIEASLMIGGILGNASEEDIRALEKLASDVGIAFQIEDDLLDIESTTEKLGKPVHSDEKNEKTTFVTLYGVEKAREEVARLTEEAMQILHTLPGRNPFLEELIISLMKREA